MTKMKKPKSKKEYWGAGFLGGFTITTCCIAPLVIILLGFGTALGMAVMHQFHIISIVSGVVLMLLLSLYLIKKQTGVCNATSIKQNWTKIALSVGILVVSWIAINYLVVAPTAAVIYGGLPVEQKPLGNLEAMAETHGMPEMAEIEVIPEGEGMKVVVLEIDGVFCGSCGPAIGYDLRSIRGVTEVVQEGGVARITYDSDVTSKDIIVASVHDPYSATIISEERLDSS